VDLLEERRYQDLLANPGLLALELGEAATSRSSRTPCSPFAFLHSKLACG